MHAPLAQEIHVVTHLRLAQQLVTWHAAFIGHRSVLLIRACLLTTDANYLMAGLVNRLLSPTHYWTLSAAFTHKAGKASKLV